MEMHRWVRRALCTAAVLMTTLALGCEAPGVGDPCNPESIPEGGFNDSEAYLETSSVQCRTRVCMVYKLPGYPSICLRRNEDGSCAEEDCKAPAGATCATAEETDDAVYCTCRCKAPPGSTASTCECPDGYSCIEVLDSEFAGEGIRGSYCVKSRTVDPEDM